MLRGKKRAIKLINISGFLLRVRRGGETGASRKARRGASGDTCMYVCLCVCVYVRPAHLRSYLHPRHYSVLDRETEDKSSGRLSKDDGILG